MAVVLSVPGPVPPPAGWVMSPFGERTLRIYVRRHETFWFRIGLANQEALTDHGASACETFVATALYEVFLDGCVEA